MSWCPILPRWRGRLALALLAVLACGAAARAQDDQTQERLDRIERDLNMLQRQVYRGTGGGPESADPSAAVNTQIRLDRIEQEMRDLTGRVEDVVNQINQLHQRIEQINGDIAARFNEAGTQSASAAPPGRLGADAPAGAARPPPDRAPQMLHPNRNVAAAGTSGTLTPPGTLMPPPAEPASAAAAAAPPGGVLPAGSTTEQYNFAFGLLKQADYSAAEQALKAFVAQHPGDVLSGNAQYWLGETYFARGRYIEAAATFAEAYKNYPRGAKAADDLLKLAMSLARAKQQSNACLALGQLDHDFPHPGAAIKERAAAEKKQLGC